MSLGDSIYDVTAGLYGAFNDHAVSVAVNPSEANLNVARDKFGKPIQQLANTTIQIVVSKADTQIQPTESGGKPVEVLEFFALPNTIKENDELTWNGHQFRVSSAWPFGLGGLTELMSCTAEREIDL